MSKHRADEERPCLHCMMVELIDDFFAEYPATAGSDKVDTEDADEVIDAIAKTIAELTSQQDGFIRQQVIEQLMRQIMHYDAEFRREEATAAVGSHAKHSRPSRLSPMLDRPGGHLGASRYGSGRDKPRSSRNARTWRSPSSKSSPRFRCRI